MPDAWSFPQLEIIELLGQGGMGAVYKAREPGLDRLVALKILPPDAARDPAFAERFKREARALAKLSHPNIVSVYGLGQTPSPPTPLPASGDGASSIRIGFGDSWFQYTTDCEHDSSCCWPL